MLSRPDPLRDTLLLVRYTEGVVIGLACSRWCRSSTSSAPRSASSSYVPLLGALLLSVVLIVFGTGPGTSNAKVNLGPMQPIEAIRLLLALFLAGYFARRWELLRSFDDTDPQPHVARWLNLPRSTTCCRSSRASAWRWCCSSSRRISVRRCCCR